MKLDQLHTPLKQLTRKFRAIANKLEGSFGAKKFNAMETLMAAPRFNSG